MRKLRGLTRGLAICAMLTAVAACTDDESKPRLDVADKYPYVQAIETSPSAVTTVDLALDSCALSIGHGASVDALDFVDTVCTQQYLDVGRVLFAEGAVTTYLDATVGATPDSHHLSFRIWNPGSSDAMRFGVNADQPAEVTAPLVEFVDELVARYSGQE